MTRSPILGSRRTPDLLAWAASKAYHVTSAELYIDGADRIATVVWPDGSPGAYACTSHDPLTEMINGYTLIHGRSGARITQPQITRGASGGALLRPEFVVAIGEPVGARVAPPAPRSFGVTMPAGATQINPGDNAASIINGASSTTTFWFAAGSHVLTAGIRPTKPHTICGAAGAVITGPGLQYLVRVAGNAAGGVIRGFVFDGTGAAVQAQRGLVQADESDGWLIEGCEVKNSQAWGIRYGRASVVRGCYSHHNAQGGIAGYAVPATDGWPSTGGADDAIVEDCEMAYNNVNDQFDIGYEAGGHKQFGGGRCIFRRNWSHHNHGVGAWWDYGNGSHQVYDNTFEDNTSAGMMLETQAAAKNVPNYTTPASSEVHHNTFNRNGWGSDATEGFVWSAGAVYLYDASAHVHHNLGVGNNGTVGILVQPRLNDADDEYFFNAKGTIVEDNEWALRTPSGTKFRQTGMKISTQWDRAPSEIVADAAAYYAFHFDRANGPTFRRNSYWNLQSLGPALQSPETNWPSQHFMWGDVLTSASTAGGSNTTTWAVLHPGDGPYHTVG